MLSGSWPIRFSNGKRSFTSFFFQLQIKWCHEAQPSNVSPRGRGSAEQHQKTRDCSTNRQSKQDDRAAAHPSLASFESFHLRDLRMLSGTRPFEAANIPTGSDAIYSCEIVNWKIVRFHDLWHIEKVLSSKVETHWPYMVNESKQT